MNEPQLVLSPLASAAIFLVLTIDSGGEETVRDLLADLSGLERTVSFRVPEQGLECVAGIGAAAWDRLFGAPRPAGLHAFAELSGARHHAPSTPGDLLFHIRSGEPGPCWEMASLIMDRLRPVCQVADEVHGFRYFDRRDLLGFVDGTENPQGRAAAAAVLDDDGGSYVIVQKYLHRMADWNTLSTEEQERVVGRTKVGNLELSDAAKPANSHVALTTIHDPDGTQRQILRDNMPFGNLTEGEYGTYFIGYAATPEVTERMLRNMFLGDPAGNTDRILDFSTAVTGSLFYAPAADFLDDLGAPAAVPDTTDGSLGIGNLTRSSAP